MQGKLRGIAKLKTASKVMAGVLCIALIVGLGAGCTAPTSTSTPTSIPGATTKPTATAEVKPIKLSFSLFFANTGAIAEAMNRVIDEVQKRSNGRLILVPYWSGSLLPLRATAEGTKAGVCDIGYILHSDVEMLLPLSQSTLQIGGAKGSPWAGLNAYNEFMELPIIKKEWTAQNMMHLWPTCSATYGYWGKPPARTIEDLKKLRIYGTTPVPEILAKLGITAVDIPISEIYEALYRGTVDGIFFPVVNVPLWKFQEVVKYGNLDIPGWGTKHYGLAINLDTWNRLPADLQKVLKEVPAADIIYETYVYKGEVAAMETIKKSGVEFINSPPDVAKTIDEVGIAPLREDWIKKTVSRGFASEKDVRDLLTQWMELNKKWAAQAPEYAKKMGWQ